MSHSPMDYNTLLKSMRLQNYRDVHKITERQDEEIRAAEARENEVLLAYYTELQNSWQYEKLAKNHVDLLTKEVNISTSYEKMLKKTIRPFCQKISRTNGTTSLNNAFIFDEEEKNEFVNIYQQVHTIINAGGCMEDLD